MESLSRANEADDDESKCTSSENNTIPSNNHDSLTESAIISNPTENELIDLDDIELSDEDTWLYTSPNKNAGNKDINSYKWLRKDVEDPSNLELQIAKTALVCKLDELEILSNAPRDKVSTSKHKDLKLSPKKTDLDENCDIFTNKDNKTIKKVSTNSCISRGNGLQSQSSLESHLTSSNSDNKSHQLLTQTYSDVTDILERARRQEESLKESSTKFFSQAVRTLPKGICSPTGYSRSKLQKPSSIEALHACNGEQNASILSPPKAPQRVALSSPNRSPFGSTASLNLPNDIHRGSLPNLNKGYYSLQKKAKRPSESRIQCPLPVYPKSLMNVANREAPRMPLGRGIPKSPSIGESQTLPSSYRTKMKPPAHLNGDFIPSRSKREPASSSPKCQRTLPLTQGTRQESASNVFHPGHDLPNGKVNTFQQSPRKNSAPVTHSFGAAASSPPSLQAGRTVSLNHLPPESNVSPTDKYPRPESQSPMKRQPLSSVHNCSTDQDDCSFQRNGERRKSSLPSKIPSPASRSGIPVPSQAASRSNQPNNGWEGSFY